MPSFPQARCKHWQQQHPVCKLGLHGGMPSAGACAKCLSFQNNQPDFLQQSVSVSKSILSWAAKGFQIVSDDIYNQRHAICSACEYWEAGAFLGSGRCEKCGCSTKAKLRLATEKCPVGKWAQVYE
jgi:hypothetical protein